MVAYYIGMSSGTYRNSMPTSVHARATRHAMAFLGILWEFLFFLVCDPLDMTQSETGEVVDSRDAATI